jgi:hypothetical protein
MLAGEISKISSLSASIAGDGAPGKRLLFFSQAFLSSCF